MSALLRRQAWRHRPTRALGTRTAKTSVIVNASAPATRNAMLSSRRQHRAQDRPLAPEAEAALKQAIRGPFRSAEEVAQTVLWLCSAGAASVTVSDLHVRGEI